jgi:hypothetical protein
MSKHTSGPWSHYDDSKSGVLWHEIVAMGKTVARIYRTNGDEIEDKANASLIAAAPDLLAALQSLIGGFGGTIVIGGSDPKAVAARAAIDKALQGAA